MKSAAEHLIFSAYLDALYYQRDIPNYLCELKSSIIKPLEAKQRFVCKEEKNNKIKNFIQQHMENFNDAPSKMIDSYLERSSKTIILDRILITDPRILLNHI